MKYVCVLLLAAVQSVVAAGSDRIALPGSYPGHLQDVWRADGNIWWAHTLHLVRTDEKGNVCAKVSVEGHHAGCEVKDGTLFVAVCPLQNTTGGRTTSDCRVQVNEYDAKTLAFKAGHVVTNLNDRAGSFCFLPDGTMLVGCLRHPALKKSEVKFHHLDKNFNLLETHVVDAGRDVRLGIEVIRRYDDDIFLFVYGGLVIRLDARTFAVTGRFTGCGGERGFARDGEDAWIGVTKRNKETQSWISWLERRACVSIFETRVVPSRFLQKTNGSDGR